MNDENSILRETNLHRTSFLAKSTLLVDRFRLGYSTGCKVLGVGGEGLRKKLDKIARR